MKTMGVSLPPPMSSPTLIGRADHRATLKLLVERVQQGMGQLVLVSGEAGVGKSRLVAEAKSYAAERGFLLLQGHCFPTDLTYSYAPLLDLLRTLLASNLASPLAAKITAVARDLFPLLPELIPEEEPPLPLLEPEQENRRLFTVLTKFLLECSRDAPIMLIIEDVHWSDDTSLDLLHHLARHSTSHPLLLLVTYRLDEMQPALRSWLAQLDRERLAHEIRLQPLSHDELGTMLLAIFDEQHTEFGMRRFLHGELLNALFTLTEGNPFFVEETLSSLVAAGDIVYVHGYWTRHLRSEIAIPRSVQDAVEQRTARLSEAARHVLSLAAVAGRHFDYVLLQRLTGYDEQQFLLLMKELVAAQLVVEASVDEFSFRHALTRQAIYTQLLLRERRSLHQTIAEMIERQSAGTRDVHLEDLAYHFYQARAWQLAADYAQRAGAKALQLYTPRAAIEYFTSAIEATAHLGQVPVPTMFHTRGLAYEMLGEFEQARRDYTQALDTAHTTNDHMTEWQSTINLGCLWAGHDYTQAETWFRQALALAQALNEPVLHAHSLNRIGNWHMNVDQSHEALRFHQEALDLFEQLHDARGLAETLDLLGMVSYLGGDLHQGTAYYHQAIARFWELGDKPGLTSSLATLTLRGATYQTDSLVSVASLAEVCQDAEHALRIAREIGHRSAEAYALLQLGLCLGSQGDYGRALAAAQQSLDIAQEIEHRQWQTAAHTVLGGMLQGLLTYEQARDHCVQALALAHESGSLFWTCIATGYLASVTLRMHDLAQAEQLLHAVLSPNTPAETMAQRMAWCASVELALAQGHPARALAIIDQLMAAQFQDTQEQHSLRVLKLRGDALVMAQRPVEAESAYGSAQALAMAQGVRPIQWRISIALGHLYQGQRRTTEAEQAFATARTVIEELAASIADEPLRDNFLHLAMARLPQRPSWSPIRRAKNAFGGLTAREREVASLIAQGKSNQAIANVLVVTKRTVETHISNVMFKLGCTSRTQIAVWAVEMGLASTSEPEPYP